VRVICASDMKAIAPFSRGRSSQPGGYRNVLCVLTGAAAERPLPISRSASAIDLPADERGHSGDRERDDPVLRRVDESLSN